MKTREMTRRIVKSDYVLLAGVGNGSRRVEKEKEKRKAKAEGI